MSAEVVVVTGASSGIGRACAERFAAESAQVVACARRGDRIAALEHDYPGRVRAETLDVRDRGAAENLIGRIHREYGKIDILVNAAGLGIGLDSIPDGDPSEWDTIFDTNVKGLLNLTKPVVSEMVRRGAGHVINIGSIAGHEMYTNGAVYCASKAAVISLTQSAGLDLIKHRINVNGIAPGVVDTPMWDENDALFAKYENRPPGEKKRIVGESVPYGRMGLPEDHAGAAVFLASSESDYMVAQTLNVDGGNWMS